jgi:hypothetical protein
MLSCTYPEEKNRSTMAHSFPAAMEKCIMLCALVVAVVAMSAAGIARGEARGTTQTAPHHLQVNYQRQTAPHHLQVNYQRAPALGVGPKLRFAWVCTRSLMQRLCDLVASGGCQRARRLAALPWVCLVLRERERERERERLCVRVCLCLCLSLSMCVCARARTHACVSLCVCVCFVRAAPVAAPANERTNCDLT